MENFSGFRRTKLNSNDRITKIEWEEKALEEGKLFSLRANIVVLPETSFYLFGVTGNLENFVYMSLPTVSLKGTDLKIFAYEGGNFTENGQIEIPQQNNNLNLASTKPSEWEYMKVVPEGDIISKGTEFYKDYIAVADGIGGRSGSAQNSVNERYKFKKNTMYCMEAKNEHETMSITLFFRLKWIEDTCIR